MLVDACRRVTRRGAVRATGPETERLGVGCDGCAEEAESLDPSLDGAGVLFLVTITGVDSSAKAKEKRSAFCRDRPKCERVGGGSSAGGGKNGPFGTDPDYRWGGLTGRATAKNVAPAACWHALDWTTRGSATPSSEVEPDALETVKGLARIELVPTE